MEEPKPVRRQRSCAECAASKRSCDHGLPCTRCVQLGLECYILDDKRKQKKSKSSVVSRQSERSDLSTVKVATSKTQELAIVPVHAGAKRRFVALGETSEGSKALPAGLAAPFRSLAMPGVPTAQGLLEKAISFAMMNVNVLNFIPAYPHRPLGAVSSGATSSASVTVTGLAASRPAIARGQGQGSSAGGGWQSTALVSSPPQTVCPKFFLVGPGSWRVDDPMEEAFLSMMSTHAQPMLRIQYEAPDYDTVMQGRFLQPRRMYGNNALKSGMGKPGPKHGWLSCMVMSSGNLPIGSHIHPDDQREHARVVISAVLSHAPRVSIRVRMPRVAGWTWATEHVDISYTSEGFVKALTVLFTDIDPTPAQAFSAEALAEFTKPAGQNHCHLAETTGAGATEAGEQQAKQQAHGAAGAAAISVCPFAAAAAAAGASAGASAGSAPGSAASWPTSTQPTHICYRQGAAGGMCAEGDKGHSGHHGSGMAKATGAGYGSSSTASGASSGPRDRPARVSPSSFTTASASSVASGRRSSSEDSGMSGDDLSGSSGSGLSPVMQSAVARQYGGSSAWPSAGAGAGASSGHLRPLGLQARPELQLPMDAYDDGVSVDDLTDHTGSSYGGSSLPALGSSYGRPQAGMLLQGHGASLAAAGRADLALDSEMERILGFAPDSSTDVDSDVAMSGSSSAASGRGAGASVAGWGGQVALPLGGTQRPQASPRTGYGIGAAYSVGSFGLGLGMSLGTPSLSGGLSQASGPLAGPGAGPSGSYDHAGIHGGSIAAAAGPGLSRMHSFGLDQAYPMISQQSS